MRGLTATQLLLSLSQDQALKTLRQAGLTLGSFSSQGAEMLSAGPKPWIGDPGPGLCYVAQDPT